MVNIRDGVGRRGMERGEVGERRRSRWRRFIETLGVGIWVEFDKSLLNYCVFHFDFTLSSSRFVSSKSYSVLL